jgi:hypothetical protein
LRFGVIDLFLQELRPLNLEKIKNFEVFPTFYSHICSYAIGTWFILILLL